VLGSLLSSFLHAVAGAQAAFDVAGVDTAGLEEGGGEGEGPRGGKGKGKAKRSRGIRSKAKASARGGAGGGAALSAEGASENSAAEAARIAGMECGVVQGGLCVCYRTWFVVQLVAVVLWGSLGLGVWHVSVPSCCINTLLCTPSFAVENDLFWLALSLLFCFCWRKFAAAQRVGVPVWRVQEALLAAERFTVALPLKAPLQAMVDRVRDLLVRVKEVVPNPATVGNLLCPCCAVGSWGRAPTFDSPLSCFVF
jgi:hypothetical protein